MLIRQRHGTRLRGVPGGVSDRALRAWLAKRYGPQEDPVVYQMLAEADTVGVFQVESRAQMATLPRLRPGKFYDLVIDCAGFSPNEADRLRQAISAKRAPERIEELRQRLLDGMAERGIDAAVAQDTSDPSASVPGRSDPGASGPGVSDPDAGPVIRPGLASVRNLSRPAADQVAAGRPYRDLEDFAVRTHLPAAALEALATAGAFGCFGLSRRAALWAAGAAGSLREGQLPGTTTGLDAQLPAMTPPEQTLADLWATSTYVAAALRALRALPSSPGVSVPSRDFR
jgi:DNA polymerase III alpha subunit